jgi:hypothetical protein
MSKLFGTSDQLLGIPTAAAYWMKLSRNHFGLYLAGFQFKKTKDSALISNIRRRQNPFLPV